ncbi:MAG: NUDIX domain-containing protein [archaeon]
MIATCALLLEKNNKLFLQLRDDKPGIYGPGLWGTFGGHLDEGENPLTGLLREIKEELAYDLVDPFFLGRFIFDGYVVFAYGKVDNAIDNLVVREGQRGAFYSLEEIRQLRCTPGVQDLAERYFSADR